VTLDGVSRGCTAGSGVGVFLILEALDNYAVLHSWPRFVWVLRKGEGEWVFTHLMLFLASLVGRVCRMSIRLRGYEETVEPERSWMAQKRKMLDVHT
jgi:hypothetical protein